MTMQEDLDLFIGSEPFVVGQVVAIFYQNPTNFYKVILVRVVETDSNFKEKEIVVTGSFGQIQEEEIYRFYGKLTDHPKFGVQFTASRYSPERPTSAAGIVNYLSSEKFPGIGKKTAENIVEALGDHAIDEIIANPAVLKMVAGLNQKKIDLLAETLQAGDGMEKIIIGLNGYGFGSQLAFSIYQTYQEETLEIIQENPYQLVDDIENIGFKKADAIAEQLGFAADSPARIRAAILYALNELCLGRGDTYTLAELLLEESLRVLEESRSVMIDPDFVANELIGLLEERRLVEHQEKLYLHSLYAAEWGISTSVKRLLERKKKINYDQHDIPKEIRKLEKRLNISYGASQIEAIAEAVVSPLFILTGGPGTGKTTVLNGIVALFAELNGLSLDINDYHNAIFPILLAAPTGRAAKRMNESTGLPSSTIHRLLGLNGREKNSDPVSERELEGGLLIVDEMSMVDTWLANSLLKAVPTNMQVILVGDKDQLPSVGPGQVLHDLLASKVIPSMELNEIYRQEDGSSIIPLAHEIKDGNLPADFTANKKDRSFFQCDTMQIENVIRQVVERAKTKGFTAQDIQVLAPMYRGPAGIDALNKMMQEIFNPNDTGKRKELKFNDKVYRIGDKVLQLVNNPESNVFNGDMGEIVGISYAKETDDKVDEMTIQFDTNEVTYKRNEWNKITLAYCCSIHKSQGSEFKMVILPMVRNYNRMLRRDLLYTAITRSRDLLILCGEPQAFWTCVERSSDDRLTTLKDRLLEDDELEVSYQVIASPYQEKEQVLDVEPKTLPEKKVTEVKTKEVNLFELEEESVEYQVEIKDPNRYILTIEMVKNNQIDPMIGMENVTPYN
ncbi:SF1B family DNA helicase RecD2 [Carnobacterium maltaromaticum]|uniref:SF1B family DNA helicase RecD2 n=1 Tax=Carnobacterium maltaromaticum TaxID=2751 RepID=UPI001071BCC8|nr:ATP-dependent RecD-like DNA helicase [Carnobacterium maltaromaticum]TFJ75196.1 ATP-dependent RecD-like DNA helicase [Carnobacterium maltaromaticum]TFJ78364.1 ATP-dependent RecD-like DNA helicase [Carnobacterium maltaromaticum]